LISHLVEAAGTPEKHQKLRDGDMSLSISPLHEKNNNERMFLSTTRENKQVLQESNS
jgi:hypothetical protein